MRLRSCQRQSLKRLPLESSMMERKLRDLCVQLPPRHRPPPPSLAASPAEAAVPIAPRLSVAAVSSPPAPPSHCCCRLAADRQTRRADRAVRPARRLFKSAAGSRSRAAAGVDLGIHRPAPRLTTTMVRRRRPRGHLRDHEAGAVDRGDGDRHWSSQLGAISMLKLVGRVMVLLSFGATRNVRCAPARGSTVTLSDSRHQRDRPRPRPAGIERPR